MRTSPLPPPTNRAEFSQQDIADLQQLANFVCHNYLHCNPLVLDAFWEIKTAITSGLGFAELSAKKNRGITTAERFDSIEKELKNQAENLHLKFTQGDKLTKNERQFLENSFKLGLIHLEQGSATGKGEKKSSHKKKITVDMENTNNSFSSVFLKSFSNPITTQRTERLRDVDWERERRGSLNYVTRTSGIDLPIKV